MLSSHPGVIHKSSNRRNICWRYFDGQRYFRVPFTTNSSHATNSRRFKYISYDGKSCTVKGQQAADPKWFLLQVLLLVVQIAQIRHTNRSSYLSRPAAMSWLALTSSVLSRTRGVLLQKSGDPSHRTPGDALQQPIASRYARWASTDKVALDWAIGFCIWFYIVHLISFNTSLLLLSLVPHTRKLKRIMQLTGGPAWSFVPNSPLHSRSALTIKNELYEVLWE